MSPYKVVCVLLSRSGAGTGGEELPAAQPLLQSLRQLPHDTEAGWLDAQGDLRLAPDIARKLRTARRVRLLLQDIRQREREG